MPEKYLWNIRSAVIAANNGDGTFGTATTVRGTVSFSMTAGVKSGKLEADGRLKAVRSIFYEGEFELEFADMQDFATLSILINQTKGTSGTAPLATYLPMTAGRELPYFALLGQATDENGKTFGAFAPKLKITSPFVPMSGKGGEFMIPKVSGTIIPDDYVLSGGEPVIIAPFFYDTAQVATIPPVHVNLTYGA